MWPKNRLSMSMFNRAKAARIHFITDTEGHFPSFYHSIFKSRVVHFNPQGQLDFRREIPNPYFIFGGDLYDRGLSDYKLTEILLDFKNRFPERVFLLVGNREATKTRLFTELNPKYIRQRLLKGSAPFWLLAKPHQLPIDYVKIQMLEQGKSTDNPSEIESYVNSLDIKDCQLIYLKWMLEQNMGCPHTIKYHTEHLAAQSGCAPGEISEKQVLDSLLEITAPTGLIGQYLQRTQMVALVPDTSIVAVHGGFTPDNIGRMPYFLKDEERIADARTWLNRMNDWYKAAVDKWARMTWDDMPLDLNPARSAIDTFSDIVPGYYYSIVTASMLDMKRQFQAVPEIVSDYLHRSKIHTVLTGHQPCGDHPAILRARDDKVVFVNGDISYADVKSQSLHNTRGLARHSIELSADANHTVIRVDACLSTGKRVENEVALQAGRVINDTCVGKLLPDNELVQCRLGSSGFYRTIKQHQFSVSYHIRSEKEIRNLLEEERRELMLGAPLVF